MMMRGLLTRQASCTVWRSIVAQQMRQGQTAATLTTVQDGTTHTHNTATWMTGAVAVAAAAGGLMWNYSQPATDCCGIVGVVAHPDFDVRCVSLIFPFRPSACWHMECFPALNSTISFQLHTQRSLVGRVDYSQESRLRQCRYCHHTSQWQGTTGHYQVRLHWQQCRLD